MKRPIPTPSLYQRMSASFGANVVKVFTPPNSAEKEAMHGATKTQVYKSVVTDMAVYQAWRRYHDGEFIRQFNKSYEAFMEEPDAGLQIIYAARVVDLLSDPELDTEKLRNLARKWFPKYSRSFPRLSNKAAFFEYLYKRLEKHADSVPV